MDKRTARDKPKAKEGPIDALIFLLRYMLVFYGPIFVLSMLGLWLFGR